MLVYTGGTFDCFHWGHVKFLKRCSQIGEVVVSLNPDGFIKNFKGRPPVMNLYERWVVVEACKYVSRVVENDGWEDSSIAIEAVKPDIIIIGSDWLERDYLGQLGINKEFLETRNISLMYIPYTNLISTTDIRKRLEASDSDIPSEE